MKISNADWHVSKKWKIIFGHMLAVGKRTRTVQGMHQDHVSVWIITFSTIHYVLISGSPLRPVCVFIACLDSAIVVM